jgi:Cys-rich repeat protein
MDMRKAFVRGLGLSLSFAVLVSGCIYSEGNDFGDWDDDSWSSGDYSQGGVGACFAFCEKLAACGTIPDEAQGSCVDHCHEAHAFTPALTEQGATCVIDAECKAVAAYDCAGAPFPPPPSAEDSGQGGGGGGGSGPVSCEADCDCPSGDQCVSGTCKTPCNASCECATGESCVGGYCELPAEPPVPCQVDCDCPSGKTCQEGVCG